MPTVWSVFPFWGLSTDDIGVPWETNASWSNGSGFADGRVGSGTGSSDSPRLIKANGTNTLGLVVSADTVFYYDWNGTAYQARYYDQSRLVYNPGAGGEYVHSDGVGNIKRFVDFNAADRPGALKSVADPAGHLTSVEFFNNSYKAAVVTRVVGTITETFTYSYVAGGINDGLLRRVVWARKVGTGATQTVRELRYTYHNGINNGLTASSHSQGPARSLRSAEIRNPSNAVIDRAYYRDYSQATAGGYIGGMKYSFGPEATARLVEEWRLANGTILNNILVPAPQPRSSAELAGHSSG